MSPESGRRTQQPDEEQYRREQLELLEIEVDDACSEYLEATRDKMGADYSGDEPWAWARLSQRLRSIERKRRELRVGPYSGR